jgi:hypothetical protein
MEEARVKQAAAAVAEADRARAELLARGVQAEASIRGREGVTGYDLQALDAFRRFVRNSGVRLDAHRAACAKALAGQQRAVLEARRRARLLENLKERRFQEWQREADRELEQAAGDSYLAQWNRRRAMP